MICGGIGGGARNALAEAGIELFPGAAGNADEQVESFLAGKLSYNPNTRCSHPVSYTHLIPISRSHKKETLEKYNIWLRDDL